MQLDLTLLSQLPLANCVAGMNHLTVKVDMVPKSMKHICFDKAQYMKEGNSKNKITAIKRKFLAFSTS